MKITPLCLLGCSLVWVACNPNKTIFVRNQTDRPIRVVLSHPGKNPFFTTQQSILHLKANKPGRDTIINYGKGDRWTDVERNELAKIFKEGVVIFTDQGDTLKAKDISVQNIGFNVNELYLRVKK